MPQNPSSDSNNTGPTQSQGQAPVSTGDRPSLVEPPVVIQRSEQDGRARLVEQPDVLRFSRGAAQRPKEKG